MSADRFDYIYNVFYVTQIGLAVGDITDVLQRAESKIESMKVSENIL